MSKLELQAVFERKSVNFNTSNCVVEQIVRLPGREFDFFRNNMLRDYDFIRDNVDSMFVTNDKTHCLLVVGKDRKDGVLVDSSGAAYARYAAFVPNAVDILALDRSPALASLSEKLTAAVDGQFIRISKDGLLTAGTYEGAIPHIGDAMFSAVVKRKFSNHNAAFTAALEAGGKKFLMDMFSGNPIPRPHADKPSVVSRIQEARLTPTKPKEHDSKKDTRGTER